MAQLVRRSVAHLAGLASLLIAGAAAQVTAPVASADRRADRRGATAGTSDAVERRFAQLEARLAELERAVAADRRRCVRIDGAYDGREEVLIAVGKNVMRFLRIKPPADPLVIGLSNERAEELHREAQEPSMEPLLPWIFRSVPAVARPVEPFLLQDRLIDPLLFAELLDDVGADARAVSHDQIGRFLAELNARCAGKAVFALPSEEQFVAAARLVYDPVANGLKPCAALRKSVPGFPFTQLLGHAWQLTRSACEPFEEGVKGLCPEKTYVRKGGDATSTNPLECIPEYRSAAPADVAQPGTSFRLVLAEAAP